MQLEAEGFYNLINTWVEMQLVATETSATIIGESYTYEIIKAFTALVFDWEASTHQKQWIAENESRAMEK